MLKDSAPSRRWLNRCFHLEMDCFPSQLPAFQNPASGAAQKNAAALFTRHQQAARTEQNNKVWPSESANIDPAEMCLAAGALQTSHSSLCAWKRTSECKCRVFLWRALKTCLFWSMFNLKTWMMCCDGWKGARGSIFLLAVAFESSCSFKKQGRQTDTHFHPTWQLNNHLTACGASIWLSSVFSGCQGLIKSTPLIQKPFGSDIRWDKHSEKTAECSDRWVLSPQRRTSPPVHQGAGEDVSTSARVG